MSHTNSTTNYGLPQFLTSDKPAWLTDINNAFSDIDTAVYAAQTKADTAFTDAGNAQTDATTAINNAAAADAKGSGAIASIEVAFDPTTIYSVGAKVMYNSLLYRCIVAVVTPGPWTGSDNWERITVDSLISSVDSKIGQLSSLSTTDKTSAVNAINEVNGIVTTVTSGTVATQTGYTDNGSYIKKYGNLVLVHINMQAPSAISNRTWVGAVSGTGMLPSTNIPFCGCGSATHEGFVNRVITGYIASNGGIYFGDNLSAGNTAIDMFCDIAYFV